MEYDKRIGPTYEFLMKAVKGIEVKTDDFTHLLPYGWGPENQRGDKGILVRPLLLLVGWTRADVAVYEVAVKSGLLRISGKGSSAAYQDLFDIVSGAVAARSSKVCMVCGERGSRRFPLNHSPCLCSTHYIQFANWMDQNGDEAYRDSGN